MRTRPLLALLALLLAPRALAAQQPAFDWPALRDEASRLLSEYLRINSTNPPGNELATARWLQDVLAREGIEGQILDTAELGPGRANFYARLRGSGGGRAIALVHHMDVVPVTPSQWSRDAFGGEIVNGEVWGRGAIDMKGHGIIQLMALIALKRAGVTLDRDLVYIANADEETDGRGAIVFVERHRDLLAGVEYLLTEGADTRVEGGAVRWFGIDVGEKRPLWTRLVVRGTTSHGSVPIGDQNPVPVLARAVARVAAWQTPLTLSPAVERFLKAQAAVETGPGRRWLADPAAALRSPAGRAWLTSEPERNALLRNTISPTVLVGSNKTNTIPQVATADLDIRLLPDQDPGAFLAELRRVIADPRVTLEEISPLPPRYSAPLGTELFRAIEATAAELLPGVPVATPISPGASDRPSYAAAGIVTYGLDPYLIPIDENRYQVHGNDERISVENVGFGVRFYVLLLQRFARAPAKAS
ncbi:MAG: M20/M25/M40 family metallo-hydrolase [Gemmatimonadetes bacterium]|nr:M20/M25/M40 family metallo-hydrolase [Gemmatimonadota bacterium]MBK7786660.1 M20/M25/M40 family metallo-hydrolase [Gemmatimonadota bacterium]